MSRLGAPHRHHYVDVGPSAAYPDTHIRIECRCGAIKVRPVTEADRARAKLHTVPASAVAAVVDHSRSAASAGSGGPTAATGKAGEA